MLNTFSKIIFSRTYWLAFLLLGICLESVALYYQYALDEWPCVLCIHVRIVVAGLIVVAILAQGINFKTRLVSIFHGLNSLLLIVLLERSWNLLGVERGFIFGSCNMDAGLPGWFALDKWFPLIFEVQTSCGYTPELLAGITMAEALFVMSIVLVAVSIAASLLTFLNNQTYKRPL